MKTKKLRKNQDTVPIPRSQDEMEMKRLRKKQIRHEKFLETIVLYIPKKAA